MGEYARQGKMGTCEDMYYLRASQRFSVIPDPGSLDPSDRDTVLHLRFRFPWPDEDHIGPCSDEFHANGYKRAVTVEGYQPPAGVKHYTVQFSAPAGYLVSLPCPEAHSTTPGLQTTVNGLQVHRNGFAGAVRLVQQKLLADGRLVPVLECGGCGTAWRVEDAAEIEALAVAFRSEGDRRARQFNATEADGRFWHQIADRILESAGMALAL